jgi:hypothetical protein
MMKGKHVIIQVRYLEKKRLLHFVVIKHGCHESQSVRPKQQEVTMTNNHCALKSVAQLIRLYFLQAFSTIDCLQQVTRATMFLETSGLYWDLTGLVDSPLFLPKHLELLHILIIFLTNLSFFFSLPSVIDAPEVRPASCLMGFPTSLRAVSSFPHSCFTSFLSDLCVCISEDIN